MSSQGYTINDDKITLSSGWQFLFRQRAGRRQFVDSRNATNGDVNVTLDARRENMVRDVLRYVGWRIIRLLNVKFVADLVNLVRSIVILNDSFTP